MKQYAGQGGAGGFWLLASLCAMLLMSAPSVAAAVPVSPLPESDYRTHSACAAPAPGRAGCMALELVAQSAAAQAQVSKGSVWAGLKTAAECTAKFPSACLTPLDLSSAYFPGEEARLAPTAAPQTIALIDAYNDPKAEADLNVYDNAFGLPAIHKCGGSESDCFEQVSQAGTSELPFPKTETEREAKETVCLTAKAKENKRELERREAACAELVEAEGWAVETSTDIEMARAICQNCKILLVEANDPRYEYLEAAEEEAVELGATEISNSWGGPQEGSDGNAFDHPGTVITASAGDDGYLNWTGIEAAEKAEEEGEKTGYFAGADYPATSPDVVAVGGTKLTLSKDGPSESVWNEDPSPEDTNQGAGGGGCSLSFTAQSWQQAVPDWSRVGCGSRRAVADVSADADPYTGVAVYDSVPSIQEEPSGELVNRPFEWWPIGGTSVASPIVASMFALAGGSHNVPYPAQTLYSHLGSSLLHDVTTGGNGACDNAYLNCSGSMEPLSPLDCGSEALICKAANGYDGPTGVGTPNGVGAFEPGEGGDNSGEPQGGGSGNGSKAGPGSEGSGPEEAGKEGGESGGPSIGGSNPSAPGVGGTPGEATPGAGSSPGASTSAIPAPRISALMLTAYAQAALRHGRLAVSNLDFSFTSSRATSVKVTLAIQTRSSGGARWRTLHSSLTFTAIRGVNRRRLHGPGRLTQGIYRLTLTPAGGTAHTLTIRVP